MKDLGKHMQTIAGAIAYEDWALVAKTAPLIAAHPQPPAAEKARIISFMGSNMGKFKSFDMQTHEAAHEMEHAAHGKGWRAGDRCISENADMAVWVATRISASSFVEHFYGKQ